MPEGEVPAHPPDLPTLTEVVEVATRAEAVRPAPPIEAVDPVRVEAVPPADDLPRGPSRPPAALLSEEQIVRKVMAELERQIDVMLEYRLREVLAPLLARTADNLVRDVRSELASTLRNVVARAVAGAISGTVSGTTPAPGAGPVGATNVGDPAGHRIRPADR